MSSVVYQEADNNYTNTKQTIQDRDIVSVIYSPNVPTIKPNRTGMLHVQIPEGTEDRKLHVWVSLATTGDKFEWMAMTEGDTLPATVAQTNKENDFQVVTQKLSGKQIMSFIDGGEQNPGDSKAIADYDGQFYIASKVISGIREVAIWVAEGTTWCPLTASVDTTNLAKLDAANIFVQPQKIGASEQRATFISGRRTAFDPTDSASPDFMPYAPGDLLFRSYLDEGATEQQVFFATVEGDAASWIPIYDSLITTVSLAADLVLLDSRQDVLSDKIDLTTGDLHTLIDKVESTDLDIGGIVGDVYLLGTKLDIIEPRVLDNEKKIAALETHHTSLASFTQGAGDGSSLLHPNCIGGDTSVIRENADSSITSTSNIFFGAPAPTIILVATLGEIINYDSTDLTGNKVREGCIQTIVNAGGGTIRLSTDGDAKFQGRTGDWDTYDLASCKTLMLHPQIWEGGEKRYNIIGIFNSE